MFHLCPDGAINNPSFPPKYPGGRDVSRLIARWLSLSLAGSPPRVRSLYSSHPTVCPQGGAGVSQALTHLQKWVLPVPSPPWWSHGTHLFSGVCSLGRQDAEPGFLVWVQHGPLRMKEQMPDSGLARQQCQGQPGLSFSGPTFPRRWLTWAGLRGASKPHLLLWKNDPLPSQPGCLEINGDRYKRLGTALFSGFQIHPPLEPALAFIKFIVQLAFFIEYCENLYTEVFVSWVTNKTAPMPSSVVARDWLGSQRREGDRVGRKDDTKCQGRTERGGAGRGREPAS